MFTEAARAAKKSSPVESDSETEKPKRVARTTLGVTNRTAKSDVRPDCYAFATDEDFAKATSLGYSTPEDMMEAYEAGNATLEECGRIKICWNPGKKGITQTLEQARFSIKDTILTQEQLDNKPILTRRAAICVVDFCPDMLWREMILRIASESSFGNKDIRDRLCHNGNYVDKATITKRLGSALGEKQQQSAARKAKKKDADDDTPSTSKNKGYVKGEDTFYNQNIKDFEDYMHYFGKRTNHRGSHL
jgi:hypothetical protein